MTGGEQTNVWYGSSGPHDATVAVVGEAWGAEEFHAKMPFVGTSGRMLNEMLAAAGFLRSNVFCTNVVCKTPPGNEIYRCFAPRASTTPRYRGLQPYPDTLADMERMYAQLRQVRPKVIIATGNYALWALTDAARIKYSASAGGKPCEGGGRLQPSGIGDFRGSQLYSDVAGLSDIPVLPIIHPAAILREWGWKHITQNDLSRRVRQAIAGDWIDKQRLNPIIAASYPFALGWLRGITDRLNSGPVPIVVDIETYGRNLITCIGFGLRHDEAYTIPFVKKEGPHLASHFSHEEECLLMANLRVVLQHPNAQLIGQNFLYDQYMMWKLWGINAKCWFDTMLAMHLWLPGEPKDLGFLSSLLCHYHRYWKDDNKDWAGKSDIQQHFLYNAEDCCRTYEIYQTLDNILQHSGHKTPFIGTKSRWDFMMKQNAFAFSMMTRGILTDTKRRNEVMRELIEAAHERDAYLLRLVPQELLGPLKKGSASWTDSTAQQMTLFYEICGMPMQKNRKTKRPSLDREALDTLYNKVPWAQQLILPLIEKRKLETFSKFPAATVSRSGRMHCSYNPGGTETFRFSSSETPMGEGTNMQNQPKGDEE